MEIDDIKEISKEKKKSGSTLYVMPWSLDFVSWLLQDAVQRLTTGETQNQIFVWNTD